MKKTKWIILTKKQQRQKRIKRSNNICAANENRSKKLKEGEN